MRIAPRTLAFVFALAWAGFGVGKVGAQSTPLYTANITSATVETGTAHVLQVLNLAQGPGTYTINTITLSLNCTTTDEQRVLFQFYTGVDTTPTSTSALGTATLIGNSVGGINPPATGNFAFIFALSTPYTFTLPDKGTVAIEIVLTTPDASAYSTTLNERFTASAPTVGTSPGYIWNDANLDGTFTGAEQTTFGMANANIRLALAGTQTAAAQPTVKSFTRSGTVSTITVDSYTGHTYQLQRTTSLTSGTWTNVGSAMTGSAGTVLTFTNDDGTDKAAFYRVVLGS